ncbi:MAG: hypothetical protein ACPF8V_06765 [Luteibaculum sp.]
MKRILAYLLTGMVFVFTAVAVLSIWEVIQVEDVMYKSIKTLVVLFVASAIVMFILQMDTEKKKP